MVKRIVESEIDGQEIQIEVSESNDNRSYHINSDKIKRSLGFIPQFTIEDAVKELCNAFKANLLPNSLQDDKYFNVIIYIPNKCFPKGVMLFPTSKLYLIVLVDKNIFDITNQYDINILNLQSLIKTYSIFNDYLDNDKLSCKL